MKPGRNDPCSCGSGKKYKNCCLGKAEFHPARSSAPASNEITQLDALFSAGRYSELESRARSLLQSHPEAGSVWKLLGLSLQMQGKDALSALQKAATLLPNDAEAHGNLAAVLRARGQLEAAVTSGRRALQIKPGFAEAHNNLGVALKDLDRLDEAVASYRHALKIKPDFAEAHNNLGKALRELRQFDSAVACYRQALKIKPDYADVHTNLGYVLNDLGQFNAALVCFRRALELKPESAEAHNNLGVALKDLGQLEDAVESYRRALAVKPDYAKANSNLLFLYSYHALIDPSEYLAEARNWEQACMPEQDRQAARHRSFQHLPLAGRRLKVGYVSGDYRQHAVSYFTEQLFTHHDRTRIELFAYSSHDQRDAVTERLQSLVDHWIPIEDISDAATRDQIDADGIDVLIDLSGHCAHNRPGVFARRAAPVQSHYLGYMASTGLTEMDYWIGDDILTPPETDSHFSEQVWRLPRVWVSYDGKADAPIPAWQPSQDGAVWLGSFNNLGKLTAATLVLWAKVLHALPEAKLLLKNKELANADNRQRILDAMGHHGISPDRIVLRDSSITPGWREHMAYYDRLDIALDPVGAIGGGTTTCDALWMGAPIIALEGDRMASRMTASMLNAIGHPEWVAHSEAGYIDKVVSLARDVEQREALRSKQRNRMASSPLCDARDLAMTLENTYFDMFERWWGREINKICTAT